MQRHHQTANSIYPIKKYGERKCQDTNPDLSGLETCITTLSRGITESRRDLLCVHARLLHFVSIVHVVVGWILQNSVFTRVLYSVVGT